MDTSDSRPTKRRVRPSYRQTEASLKSQLVAAQEALEQARHEKQKLEENEAALQNIIDYISELTSVLIRADVHCSLVPSSRLSPEPVQTFAHLSIESAWRGKSPRKEWIDLWASMPPDAVKQIHHDFVSRLETSYEYWNVVDDITKVEIEESIKTVITVRSDILYSITMKNPKLMMQLQKFATPPPTDPESSGPLNALTKAIEAMNFTEEQRINIRESWGKFCHSRGLLKEQMTQLSLSQVDMLQNPAVDEAREEEEEPCFHLKPEKFRAENRTSAFRNAKKFQDCQFRLLTAQTQLAVEVVGHMTWQQFAVTNLSIRPYTNDITQWCRLFSEIHLN